MIRSRSIHRTAIRPVPSHYMLSLIQDHGNSFGARSRSRYPEHPDKSLSWSQCHFPSIVSRVNGVARCSRDAPWTRALDPCLASDTSKSPSRDARETATASVPVSPFTPNAPIHKSIVAPNHFHPDCERARSRTYPPWRAAALRELLLVAAHPSEAQRRNRTVTKI